MATVTNYPMDLPILVIEAQIFVAVNKFRFLPNKHIPSVCFHTLRLYFKQSLKLKFRCKPTACLEELFTWRQWAIGTFSEYGALCVRPGPHVWLGHVWAGRCLGPGA